LGYPAAVRAVLPTGADNQPSRIATQAPRRSPAQLLPQYLLATYDDPAIADAVASRLHVDSRILSVEKNFTFSWASTTPTDKYFGPSSPVDPTLYQWGMHALNFPMAWDITKGNAYVGLLDNGIEQPFDTTSMTFKVHPDLTANFRPQFARSVLVTNVTSMPHPSIVDEALGPAAPAVGHGTHTSGIIAANTTQVVPSPVDSGVAGGCWNCPLLMAQTDTSYVNLNAALTHLVGTGAQVVNMSLTISANVFPGCSDIGTDYRMFCMTLLFARQQGVVLVASSGNNYNTTGGIGFPAQYWPAIAVGGLQPGGSFWQGGYVTTPSGSQAFGSDYGPAQALIAPAISVLSTFYNGGVWYPIVSPANQSCVDDSFTYGTPPTTVYVGPPSSPRYGLCSGTSMAAPHVTAVAALMRSANPMLSAADVKMGMMSTASLGDTGWNEQQGSGVPNAYAAVLDALGKQGGVQQYNRLTPLFGFNGYTVSDHFYTTVPQMALAALNGTLRPKPRNLISQSIWSVTCQQVSGNNCIGVPFSEPVVVSPPAWVSDPFTYSSVPNAAVTFIAMDPSRITTPSYPVGYAKAGTDGYVSATTFLYQTQLPATPFQVKAFTDSESAANPNYLPDTVLDLVPNYPCFPNPYCAGGGQPVPRSAAYIYTTPVPPPGTQLKPLYRFSYRCGDELLVSPPPPSAPWQPSAGCASSPVHLSHFYASSESDVLWAKGQGFQLDGIEGYVFSPEVGPPGGAVKLHRFCNVTLGDCALFTPAKLSTMAALGYTQPVLGLDFVGYAYTVPTTSAPFTAQTAVYRPSNSTFRLDYDFDHLANLIVPFGDSASNDVGLVADMNGDGISDLVVYRPGTGAWYVDTTRDGIGEAGYIFGGIAGDVPLLADFNGDGTPDLVIYRGGSWYVDFNRDGIGDAGYAFGGVPGDIPLAGDVNGDGIADLVIFRSGAWYIDTNRNGFGNLAVDFGMAGDVPYLFDWDGDGRADLVLYRNGIWYVNTLREEGMATYLFGFGATTDKPLLGRFH